MDYKKDFERLLDAARQVSDNVDFDKRKVYSFAALRVLRNAVNFYDNEKQPVPKADHEKRCSECNQESSYLICPDCRYLNI